MIVSILSLKLFVQDYGQKYLKKLKDMGLIEFENEGKNAQCWVIRGDGKEEDKVIVRSKWNCYLYCQGYTLCCMEIRLVI